MPAAEAVKVLQAAGLAASKPRRVHRLWLVLLPWLLPASPPLVGVSRRTFP